MAKADLHIHTTASDGKMAPSQVVEEAVSLQLSTIAITDHDTIAALPEAVEAARDYDIDVMPGVEVTSLADGKECHLLAYGFDPDDEVLRTLLRDHQQARVDRAQWIIGQLRGKGFDLDIDEVIAEAGGRNVGRPHLAEVLREKGYVGSIREAFIRHLSNEALGTIKSNYRSIADVIAAVKEAGGVTVIAHPGRLYDQTELAQFVNAGIDGIEVIHRSHTYEIQKAMEIFADGHHLLQTGGSDFHGSKKGYYPHFGTLTINNEWVRKIKSLAARRKEISV